MALPQPPNTNQNVPNSSAPNFEASDDVLMCRLLVTTSEGVSGTIVAAAQVRSTVQRPSYFADFIVAAHRNSTHARLDRSPYSVVPESPHTGGRVPHELSPRRPRRGRWLRRRPHRCGPPGPRARRTTLARRTLPVVAMTPVPVVNSAPARVPLITWAPVTVGRRGGGRLSPGTAN